MMLDICVVLSYPFNGKHAQKHHIEWMCLGYVDLKGRSEREFETELEVQSLIQSQAPCKLADIMLQMATVQGHRGTWKQV